LQAGQSLPLAVDIETPYKASQTNIDEGSIGVGDDPTFTILRVGFAYPGSVGLSLAWRSDYLSAIQELLHLAPVIVTWNGTYDCPRLEASGMLLPETEWDGMLAWHVINSDLPKGLGFVAPLLLNIPRWKHLGGSDPGKYNALDAVITIRLMMRLKDDLEKGGFWPTFDRHIVQLGTILAKMKHTGIRFDQEGRRQVSADLTSRLEEAAGQLNQHVPAQAKEIHPKQGYAKTPKSLEGLVEIPHLGLVRYCQHCGEKEPKAAHFAKCGRPADWNTRKQGKWPARPRLYREEKEMGSRWAELLPFTPSINRMVAYARAVGHKPIMKKDKKTGKIKPTFDDDALKALRVKHPEDPVYPLVDAYRDASTERGFVGIWQEATQAWKGGMPVGKDGKIHASLGHNPSSLRLSCLSPNLQQMKRTGPLRSLFMADPGYHLCEVDFSAIESVLVGYGARSPEMIRVAKLGIHDYFNSHILAEFGKIPQPADIHAPDEELRATLKDLKVRFGEEREVAKRLGHAANYGQQGREVYRKYPELFGSEQAATKLHGIYFKALPMIRPWQEGIVLRAEEEAQLRNPFGYLHRYWRVCEYKQGPDGEWQRSWAEDAKRALSYEPQSTAAGIIKEAMLALEQEYQMASRGWLLLQVHDSLLFQFPEQAWEEWLARVMEVMTRPIPQLPLPWGRPGECLSIGVEAKEGLEWGKDPKRGKKGMTVWAGDRR
jgi:hypothetical protein